MTPSLQQAITPRLKSVVYDARKSCALAAKTIILLSLLWQPLASATVPNQHGPVISPYATLSTKLLTISEFYGTVEDFEVEVNVATPADISPAQSLDDDEHGLRKEAITSYLAAKYNKDEETVREYVDLAWGEAKKHEDVSPELILAVVQKESGLRAGIKNKYGAQGLMQVVARWHPEKLQKRESLFDPSVNIRVGAQILQEYLSKAKGGLSTALIKYSGNSRGYVESIIREQKRLATIGNIAQAESDEG